jgi:peptide/nickel transport system permease protein
LVFVHFQLGRFGVAALAIVHFFEVVFGLPGLGREAVQAITTQDLPIIMGITILSSALVVAANLGVDRWHALLDPRVRLE